MVINNHFEEDPMEYIEAPKWKALPKILSYEEVYILLNIDLKTNYDYRNKAMLELMYATGLRVSELVNLKVNDIDLESDIVRTIGKGNKERIIPIGEYAPIFLKEYIIYHRDALLKIMLQIICL